MIRLASTIAFSSSCRCRSRFNAVRAELWTLYAYRPYTHRKRTHWNTTKLKVDELVRAVLFPVAITSTIAVIVLHFGAVRRIALMVGRIGWLPIPFGSHHPRCYCSWIRNRRVPFSTACRSWISSFCHFGVCVVAFVVFVVGCCVGGASLTNGRAMRFVAFTDVMSLLIWYSDILIYDTTTAKDWNEEQFFLWRWAWFIVIAYIHIRLLWCKLMWQLRRRFLYHRQLLTAAKVHN